MGLRSAPRWLIVKRFALLVNNFSRSLLKIYFDCVILYIIVQFTMTKQNQVCRIALLARQTQPVFHSQDLARLWDISNPNTLYTTLKRYNQKGLLFKVYKGLYSLFLPEKLDPLLVGLKALHGYAYVSTETILIQSGLMFQVSYKYTLVSNISRDFKVGANFYKSRQLADKYLYNPAGIIEADGILKATPLRALSDMLYFNPKFYFDGIKTVDLKKLNELQREIGYPLTKFFYASPAQRGFHT